MTEKITPVRYKHLIDIRFNTHVERSPRVLDVAEAFGLGLDDTEFVIYDNLEFETVSGDCVYITGQSGSGKSLLLRELERQYREDYQLRVGNIDDIVLDDRPLIDQIGESTDDACRILSIAGLNDAYLFIRKPSELSDGQRYRFKIAKLIESGTEVVIADEFGAVLDRVTAKVIAYAMRRLCQRNGITLVVATTHKDLYWDLRPDITVYKSFSERMEISTTDSDIKEQY